MINPGNFFFIVRLSIFMKLILAFLLLLYSSCEQKKALQQKEPDFSNKINVRHQEIELTAADAVLLKKAEIIRSFYYKKKNDSGFVYRTLALGCYTLSSSSFTGHEKRKTISTLPDVSDIFKYGDCIYEYNTKTKMVKPFMTDKALPDSSKIYMLSKAGDYNPMLPFNSNRLIEQNGQLKFIYNYSAKKSKKPNFVDISPFIIVTDSNQYEKIGRYPPVFFEEELGTNDTWFDIDSNNNIFYVHACFDSVYKINIKGEELCRSILHQYPKRDKYSPPKTGDLAYDRNYRLMNEQNESLFLLNNKYVIVIKQLARKKIIEKPAYKIFIFNTNLEKLYVEVLNEDIFPGSIPNNNGFLLITRDLKKSFRYELP
jgi:hypothetical protein